MTEVEILQMRLVEAKQETERLQARLEQVKAVASEDKYLRVATTLARLINMPGVKGLAVGPSPEHQRAWTFVRMVHDADLHAMQMGKPQQEVPVL